MESWLKILSFGKLRWESFRFLENLDQRRQRPYISILPSVNVFGDKEEILFDNSIFRLTGYLPCKPRNQAGRKNCQKYMRK
jgi:hypothetical protein